MELRLPLEMSPGREAACRAVFGTWVFSERCTERLPLRVDCIHRLEFGEVSGHRVPAEKAPRLLAGGLADCRRALKNERHCEPVRTLAWQSRK